jgi:AcrR family transcriptional regulator
MSEFTKRQQEIIEAAIGIIAGKGIQKMTIKNLAKSIGITEGAIYRHFSTKLDILLGILSIFREQIRDNFTQISSDHSAYDVLAAIITRQIDMFVEKPIIAAVIFSEEIFQNEKQLSETVFSIMSDNSNTFLEIIKNGQDKGELRNDVPAEQLSNMLMGAIRLLITRWRLSGFAFDLKSEGNILIDSFKKILTRE